MANGSEEVANAKVLAEILTKLNLFGADVNEVRTDQKSMATQVTNLAADARHAAPHDGRITALETKWAYLLGWVAAAGFFGAIIGSVIMVVLTSLFRKA